MAKSKKYYVVWEGREIGIFETWAECKQSIDGYTGAKYKSFKSEAMAEEAYFGNYDDYTKKNFKEVSLSAEELRKIGQPNMNSMSVDAACSSNGGFMEYQGVDTKTGAVFFRQGPYPDGTNNVGEFLALVHGLAFLKKWGREMPIYSDSRTAMKWVRDIRCKTTLKPTAQNKVLFDLIKRGENWLRANPVKVELLKWETKAWGEISADFGRK